MTRPIFARGLGTSPAGPAGRDGINAPPDGAFLLYATEDTDVADAHPEYAWVILGSNDTTAPTVPTGLTATPGNAQVVLSWTASTDAVGVTAYKVRRGGTVIASPTTTTYTDTGRTNGTSYSYTVSAVDLAGNESAQTSAATATPAAPGSSRADTFNRANTTTAGLGTPSDAGAVWTQPFGLDGEPTAVLHVNSNLAVSSIWASDNTAPSRWEGAVTACGSPNGTATVTLGGAPTTGSTMGLLLRFTDESNFVAAFPNLDYNSIALYKCVGGTVTYVGGLNGSGLTATSVFSCVMSGTTYQFKFDGTNVGSVQTIADVPLTGNHGLVASSSGFTADSWGYTP